MAATSCRIVVTGGSVKAISRESSKPVTEALGAQIMVHFDIDAPKVVTEDTKLLDKDAHTDEVPQHLVEGTKFVASFAPRPRVRAGDEIEVVVDTERMHFFDRRPASPSAADHRRQGGGTGRVRVSSTRLRVRRSRLTERWTARARNGPARA